MSNTSPVAVTVRLLLRRSSDENQEFSLDVQREGCLAFADHLRTRMPPVEWHEIREYLDDGIAGDDFLGRAGLRQLLDDLAAGDAVVCRDHSRLGRDALEVTLVVREIVRRRGARLFYYASGQEVTFTNAIDAATTFIQGVGAQMELEAIRSRTREALRSRVRQGRIAGGKCYGYTYVRERDASGRAYTVAVVNEAEAKIVREIFERYMLGEGLKKITDSLNRRGVRPPAAGKRGTGSWSTGAIHEMLRRERYRGVYVHGKINRVKYGGKRIAKKAPAEKVLRVELPHWRIIDEHTWAGVQEASARRRRDILAVGPAAKYPLTGVARCGVCGGPISGGRTKLARGRVVTYVCSYHQKRGNSVCPVAIYQPADEVERPLFEYLRDVVLPRRKLPRFVEDVRARVRAAVEATATADVQHLRSELARLRREQRRYAAAISTAPGIAEIVSEMKKRSARIQVLEAELAASSSRASGREQALDLVAPEVTARLKHFYEAIIASPRDARAVFGAFFERGLVLVPRPAPTIARRRWGRMRRFVWRVELRSGGSAAQTQCPGKAVT